LRVNSGPFQIQHLLNARQSPVLLRECGGIFMAIYRMLNGMFFSERAVKGMTAAYEAALVELGLADRSDPLTKLLATKIIMHCQTTGQCDPERLCERVLKDIRR
jgi:hypothetical protein